MKTSCQLVGAHGEALAAAFLQERGYDLLEQNARTPYGELDLVMCQGEPVPITVFVEVKARRSTRYGLPEASITPAKRRHLLDSAQAYLLAHPELAGDWRIDVVAILWESRVGPVEIVHFENAITD